jgi:hypothetical protein
VASITEHIASYSQGICSTPRIAPTFADGPNRVEARKVDLACDGTRLSIMVRRLAVCCLLLGASCATVGPGALRASRARYNETIKATAEEELLLNIVRLRYGDTPSSLAISSIAAQFELAASLGGTPFYSASADPTARAPFPLVLPQAQVGGADRPTFSLTPLDDSEFARRLFTPLSLEGAVYLARTTWPISTVFRLYLENLNWVPNAQTASGPTPARAPEGSAFLEGLRALQVLQDRGDIVFGHEERVAFTGGAIPANTVTAQAAIDAAEQGLELAPSTDGGWRLQKKERVPVLYVNPRALDTPETTALRSAFHLAPGRTSYEVTVESITPFAEPTGGFTRIDLETRSLLQALYFVAHGVEVPAEHLTAGLARVTKKADGAAYDWSPQLEGLFRVRSAPGGCGGAGQVRVEYRGACFFIDVGDHDTRATFALLMELSRLEVPSSSRNAPILTLPLGQ